MARKLFTKKLIATVSSIFLAALLIWTVGKQQTYEFVPGGIMFVETDLVKSDPMVVKPDPDLAKSDPKVVKPDPDLAKSDPKVVKPDPDLAKSDPKVVNPDSELVKSDPTVVQPNLTLTNGHSITLTIHMTASVPALIEGLYCIALRSAALFWSPKLGKIGLIYDDESQKDHEFAASLKKQEQLLGFKFDMMYQPLPADPSFFTKLHSIKGKGAGYNRQLWNSFFMDEYVKTSVIAWTDTDVMFTTPVTPENIFNGDKIKTFGEPAGVNNYLKSTYSALGKKMIAQYTCFPIYMWRDTITNCRNHIIKHMNVTSFEEAFVKFDGAVSCPINILYTYAYYFEYDRYEWHVRIPGNLEKYNKQYLSPGFSLKLSELVPTVCNSMHKPYYDRKRIGSPFHGYCMAMRSIEKTPESCKTFKEEYDLQLMESRRYSGRVIPEWCGGKNSRAECVKVSNIHYKNVARHWKTGLFDFDLQKMSNVEKAAQAMNINCRKIEM